MKKSALLKDLNARQKEAILATKGPLLVIAGAGTGKTELITRKISYLIESRYAKPSEILALTFTEKAASEMLGRVDELSSYIYPDVAVSTFHGFGERVLREHAFEIGLTTDFRILSEAEQLLFLHDNLFALGLKRYLPKSDPTAFLSSLSRNFSRVKDELITGKDYVAEAKRLQKLAKTAAEKEKAANALEVANAYERYCALAFEAGYLDWGDLILQTYLLMKSKPSVLASWRGRFKFVLVDEFQDTNYAQYELIKLIARGKGITAVADDDQAIYRFRGAAAYNALTFLKDFRKAKKITLTENYRNTQIILDFSHAFIKHNDPDRLEARIKISKKLHSNSGLGMPPELKLFDSAQAEGDAIAAEISSLAESGASYKDIAVLTRSNKQAEPIIHSLAAEGVPYIFSGASGLYSREEIKIVLALLQCVADPDDNLALYHLAISEAYGIAVDEMSELLHRAKRSNARLIEAMKSSRQDHAAFGHLLDDLEYMRELTRKGSAGQVLNAFLKRSGYLKRLVEQQDEGDSSAANKIIALSNFFDRILEFQNTYRDHSLQKFVEYIRLMLKVGEDPKSFEVDPSIDAVRVLTMHQAKGLEFDTVFISSLSDSHIPGKDMALSLAIPASLINEDLPEGDEHLLEERRLFYVAATRAKKKLVLTSALNYGTKRTHKISRFVLEAMPDVSVGEAFTKSLPIEKLKTFEVSEKEGLPYAPLPKGKLVLSQSKIEDYNTCPLKYKFFHVVPIKVIPDQAVAYGTAVHNTISEYFNRRSKGVKVSLSKMLDLFDSKWESQGFLSIEHEEARYRRGRESLAVFYKRFNSRPLPESFEEKFAFKIGDCLIEGRYDMVDVVDGRVRIVDFKTTDTVRSKEQADERTKRSDQLKIYAYGYLKNHGRLPDEVSLYFTDLDLTGVYNPTPRDMEKIEEVIKNAIAGIRASDFRATPSLKVCSYCPFRFYCPYAILDKAGGK